MKLIKLGRTDVYAQVSDEDYDEVSKYKWQKFTTRKMTYVRSWLKKAEREKTGTVSMFLHRYLLGITDPKIWVDHADGNPLNNQRENLRVATPSENGANRHKRKTKENTSMYIGVSKLKHKNSKYEVWSAQCRKDGIIHRKYHKNEIEAALWYNEKAKELHGEFAKQNIINQKQQ